VTDLLILFGPCVAGLVFFLVFWWTGRRSAPTKEHMPWEDLVRWGRTVGLTPRTWETYANFRARVSEALRNGRSEIYR